MSDIASLQAEVKKNVDDHRRKLTIIYRAATKPVPDLDKIASAASTFSDSCQKFIDSVQELAKVCSPEIGNVLEDVLENAQEKENVVKPSLKQPLVKDGRDVTEMLAIAELRVQREIACCVYKQTEEWLEEVLASANLDIRGTDAVSKPCPKTPAAKRKRFSVAKSVSRRSSIIMRSINRPMRSKRAAAKKASVLINHQSNDDSKSKKSKKTRTASVVIQDSKTTNSPAEKREIPKKIDRFSRLPHVKDKVTAFENIAGENKKNTPEERPKPKPRKVVQTGTPCTPQTDSPSTTPVVTSNTTPAVSSTTTEEIDGAALSSEKVEPAQQPQAEMISAQQLDTEADYAGQPEEMLYATQSEEVPSNKKSQPLDELTSPETAVPSPVVTWRSSSRLQISSPEPSEEEPSSRQARSKGNKSVVTPEDKPKVSTHHIQAQGSQSMAKSELSEDEPVAEDCKHKTRKTGSRGRASSQKVETPEEEASAQEEKREPRQTRSKCRTGSGPERSESDKESSSSIDEKSSSPADQSSAPLSDEVFSDQPEMRVTRSKFRKPKASPTIEGEEVKQLRSKSPARPQRLSPSRKFSSVSNLSMATASTLKRKNNGQATPLKRQRISSDSEAKGLQRSISHSRVLTKTGSSSTPDMTRTTSFVRAVMNKVQQSGRTSPQSGNTLSRTLSSFIKRATPVKSSRKEEAEEKGRKLKEKMLADTLRRKEAEREKNEQLEAKKQQRIDREKKAALAREAARQEMKIKQKQLEEKSRQYDAASALEKKQREEKEKALIREQKSAIAEEKRKREEDLRQQRLRAQETEGRRQAEALTRRRELEEQERKKAAENQRLVEKAKQEAMKKVTEQRLLQGKTATPMSTSHKSVVNKMNVYTGEALMNKHKQLGARQAELAEERARLAHNAKPLTTSTQHNVPAAQLNTTFDAPPVQEFVNFMDLKDYDKDDEFDTPRYKRMRRPGWVQGDSFRLAVVNQLYHPPDFELVFGNCVDSPDLATIFTHHRPRFFKRTSSAHWSTPPLKRLQAKTK